MADTTRRSLGTALGCAGLLLALAAGGAPARADMALSADGKWWPESGPKDADPPIPWPDGTEEPSDDALNSTVDKRLDATWETVKGPGYSKPAGMVLKVRSSERTRNDEMRQGYVNLAGNAYVDAADNFEAAAAALTGLGKQEALYNRVLAYRYAGAVDKINPAIDELVAAFPSSYYYADVMILRARLAVLGNDVDGASKALAAVAGAKGMNPRDLLRAEHARIFLTLEAARKHEEALAAYTKLLADADRVDAAMSGPVKEMALVGIGNCQYALRKAAPAADAYKKATESKDREVLAGAYTGLGDLAFGEAKAQRDAGKLPEAKAKLEEAVLHYLRVTILYAPDVDDTRIVNRALANLFAAYRALFDMTGGKDPDLAQKAIEAGFDLWRHSDTDAATKRTTAAAIKELQEKRKALLAGTPPAPAKDGDTKGAAENH
jgi:tetratricopeptide (TPR) repeat protein